MIRCVLIVDDENTPRETMAGFIDWKSLGITTVWQAEDGEAALEIAIREKPFLVISDIKMPHMNGLQLAEQLRHYCPECLFIFLSGYADKENLKEAIKLKAARFVEKPIDLNEITDTVRELITESERVENGATLAECFFEIPAGGSRNAKVFQIDKPTLREFEKYLKTRERAAAEGWLRELSHKMVLCHATDPEYIRNVFRQVVFILTNMLVLDYTEHLLHNIQCATTISQIVEQIQQELTLFFDRVEVLDVTPFAKLKTYLDEHFSEPEISVQSVAHALNFTPNYLCMLFKKNLDTTITQYLTELRISKARELLSQTSLRLYDIALQSGYTDGKYFTRVFTKALGVSPRQYRERYSHEK